MNQRGLTLIEIMVAIGIFSLLLIILVGLFSQFTLTQRRDIADQKLLEDLRFAVEIFNREARTSFGSTFALTGVAGEGVVMRNQNGTCVHFRFDEGFFQRAESDAIGQDCNEDSFNNAVYAIVVSSNVVFDNLHFEAVPAEVEDDKLVSQGFVTMAFEAHSAEATTAPIALQSTITSRQLVPFISP